MEVIVMMMLVLTALVVLKVSMDVQEIMDRREA